LYKTFNGALGSFTARARVVGPINYLTANYQQVAAFFGPDQSNFAKIEIEHNGVGDDPHISFFYEEKGSGSTVATVSMPTLTTASTVDLILVGSSNVPDPIPASSDTNKVRGYPLAQITAYYSINGGAPVQIGTVQSPADITSWFSTAAKAGILTSNSGTSTSFSATFSSFSITSP